MDGGPSHFETFDPKPDAPAEVRGEFGSVALLPLRDARDHVVIEVLHDAEDPDARNAAGLAGGHD